jgi:hypothetical protein
MTVSHFSHFTFQSGPLPDPSHPSCFLTFITYTLHPGYLPGPSRFSYLITSRLIILITSRLIISLLITSRLITSRLRFTLHPMGSLTSLTVLYFLPPRFTQWGPSRVTLHPMGSLTSFTSFPGSLPGLSCESLLALIIRIIARFLRSLPGLNANHCSLSSYGSLPASSDHCPVYHANHCSLSSYGSLPASSDHCPVHHANHCSRFTHCGSCSLHLFTSPTLHPMGFLTLRFTPRDLARSCRSSRFTLRFTQLGGSSRHVSRILGIFARSPRSSRSTHVTPKCVLTSHAISGSLPCLHVPHASPYVSMFAVSFSSLNVSGVHPFKVTGPFGARTCNNI